MLQVAKEFGISEKTLGDWVRAEEVVVETASGPGSTIGNRSHGMARSASADPYTRLRAAKRMKEQAITVPATYGAHRLNSPYGRPTRPRTTYGHNHERPAATSSGARERRCSFGIRVRQGTNG